MKEERYVVPFFEIWIQGPLPSIFTAEFGKMFEKMFQGNGKCG